MLEFRRQIYEISLSIYPRFLKLDDYNQISRDFNCRISIICGEGEDDDIVIKNFNYQCPAFVTIGMVRNNDDQTVNLILRKRDYDHLCLKPIKLKFEDRVLEINKQLVHVAAKPENFDRLKKLCAVRNIESARILHQEMLKALNKTSSTAESVTNKEPQPGSLLPKGAKLDKMQDLKGEKSAQTSKKSNYKELGHNPGLEKIANPYLNFILSSNDQIIFPENRRHAIRINYAKEYTSTANSPKSSLISNHLQSKRGFSLEPNKNSRLMFTGNNQNPNNDFFAKNNLDTQFYFHGSAGATERKMINDLNYEKNPQTISLSKGNISTGVVYNQIEPNHSPQGPIIQKAKPDELNRPNEFISQQEIKSGWSSNQYEDEFIPRENEKIGAGPESFIKEEDFSKDQNFKRSKIENFGHNESLPKLSLDLSQSEGAEENSCPDCQQISETDTTVAITCNCKICYGCLLSSYIERVCRGCNINLNHEDLEKLAEIF